MAREDAAASDQTWRDRIAQTKQQIEDERALALRRKQAAERKQEIMRTLEIREREKKESFIDVSFGF